MDDSDNHLHIKDTCNLQNSTWVLESAMSRFSTQKLGSQKTWFISVSSRIIPLYAFGMTEVLATHHDNYFLYNPGNKNSHFPYKSKIPELEEMKSKFTPFNWGQKWGAIGMVGAGQRQASPACCWRTRVPEWNTEQLWECHLCSVVAAVLWKKCHLPHIPFTTIHFL